MHHKFIDGGVNIYHLEHITDPLPEVGAEAGEDAMHQIRVGDGAAEVAQAVSKRLQARAVGGDGHVAMPLPVELVVEVDGASYRVVEAEVLDVAPDRERSVVRRKDEGEISSEIVE